MPERASHTLPPLTADASTLPAMQQAVLAWFAHHGRDLPWRTTRDPYHILVSEVMLQQTQVDRVRPKYHAFLAAFPTLAALAAAPTAEVIRQWAGLGYNRRAVNLQRTARTILSEHGGQFPRTVAELRQLPGIGSYTAGAVACFAFEQDVAFLDTNIRRVLRRAWVAPEGEPPATNDHALHRLGEQLIPAGRGWQWNQAIMELGALICTTTAPACWRCPLQAHCRSYAAWRTRDEQIFDAAASPYPLPHTRPRLHAAEHRSEPFVGSTRYYRGRIIDVLRTAPAGSRLTPAQIGAQIKPDFAATDQPWIGTLLQGLHRDGLLDLNDAGAALPV